MHFGDFCNSRIPPSVTDRIGKRSIKANLGWWLLSVIGMLIHVVPRRDSWIGFQFRILILLCLKDRLSRNWFRISKPLLTSKKKNYSDLIKVCFSGRAEEIWLMDDDQATESEVRESDEVPNNHLFLSISNFCWPFIRLLSLTFEAIYWVAQKSGSAPVACVLHWCNDDFHLLRQNNWHQRLIG